MTRRQKRGGLRKALRAVPLTGVPIHWEQAEDVDTRFANVIYVRRDGELMVVTFGEARPPIGTMFTKETVERLKKDGIVARPVANLAIPVDRLRDMIERIRPVLELTGDGTEEQSG